MTKTLIKIRDNPLYKIKSQTQILKDNNSTNLPSNPQSSKRKILSGNGFFVYRQI